MRRRQLLEFEPEDPASAAAARLRAPPRRRAAGQLGGHRREGGILEPACRDPFGERRRVEVDVEAYPCVVTHRDAWTPIDAIFRGPSPFDGGIQTPVSPSIRAPSSANARSVAMIASSRSRTYFFRSRPCRLRSRIG